MNEEQRAIFSKLVNANYECSQKREELTALQKEVYTLDQQFRKSMGMEAYMRFMANGKKMFAPIAD
jgi:hypothetical protein